MDSNDRMAALALALIFLAWMATIMLITKHLVVIDIADRCDTVGIFFNGETVYSCKKVKL